VSRVLHFDCLSGISGDMALTKSAIVAITITLAPQGVWSMLIVANLRTVPAIPWSVFVMTVLMVVGAQYLHGRWGPSSTGDARRQLLRATVVSREMFGWVWLAGALSMIALVGVWILLASFVRMPGSVLPDLSAYPPWTAALAVGMGALISPLCEQAGIWGWSRLARVLRARVATRSRPAADHGRRHGSVVLDSRGTGGRFRDPLRLGVQ
jgi:hypothetical protein